MPRLSLPRSVYAFRRSMLVRTYEDELVALQGDEAVTLRAGDWYGFTPLMDTRVPAPSLQRRRYCFKCLCVTTHLYCENCGGYLCMPHSSVDVDYPYEYSNQCFITYVHKKCMGDW